MTSQTEPIRPTPGSTDGDVGISSRPGHTQIEALRDLVPAYLVGQIVVLAVAGHLSDIVEDLDLAARVALADGPRGGLRPLQRGRGERGGRARRARVVRTALARLARCPGGGGRARPASRPDTERDAPGWPSDGDQVPAAGAVLGPASRLAGCRVADRLTPHPTAPRASRDFVSRTLLDWRLSQLIPAACLVISELVTNASIHAGGDIELTVSEHRRAVRLAVRDHSPDLPVGRHPGLDTHGRGLTIVGGLCHRVGRVAPRRRRQGGVGRARGLVPTRPA